MTYFKHILKLSTCKKVFNLNLMMRIARFTQIMIGVVSVFIFMQSCTLDEEKVKLKIDEILLSECPDATCTYDDGIVCLKGNVLTEEDKINIEKKIRKMQFVKVVKNDLSIHHKYHEIKSLDEKMYASIIKDLSSQSYDNITVKVRNGIVTLSGKIHNHDLPKVMNITCSSNPRQVRANLVLIDQ